MKEIRNLNTLITKWITEQVNGFENIKSLRVEKKQIKQNERIDKKI